jgi:hypothetical protein
MTRPYLITAPPYNEKSAGQAVMHKMCHELNQLGYEAYLVLMQNPNWPKDMPMTNPSWNTPVAPLSKDLIKNSIVVYPEIVTGNPLGAPRVVRYLLNKEAQFGQGPIKRAPSDYFLIYSNLYGTGHGKLLIPHFNFELFNEFGAMPFDQRTQTAWYEGKGGKYGKVSPIEGAVTITRQWPEDRQELAAILKKTKVLFTWDSTTSLITEAMMCGVVPVFMQLAPWTVEGLKNTDFGISGFALSTDDAELYRAIQTRDEAMAAIRRSMVKFREDLWTFVDSSQNHFEKLGI